MDKQALLAYLDAVCDAESAVQACEDAIVVYNAQRQALSYPTAPTEPTKSDASIHVKDTPMGWIPGIVIGIVISWNLFVNTSSLIIFFITFFIIFPVSTVIIATIIAGTINHMIAKFKQSGEQEDLDSKYSTAYQEYQVNLGTHQANVHIVDRISASLSSSIQKQTTLRDTSKTKLQELYSMNILHPSCQNLIAAYQIREYLQMGICDTLDGPTGAYAQYMNDVRTARICNSITDLKRSLTSALHSLQSTLVHELRTVDSNLSGLRSDMSASMNDLNNRMQQMHNSTHAQLESHHAEANRLLSRMNENASVMAHNQYVEQRLRNVDTYLLKVPKGI